MTKFIVLTVTLSVLALGYSPNLLAHGEDKPGPHGGYIRMPGAFHTELVKTSGSKITVYLLDIEWKNPTIKNSTIEVTVKLKGNSTQAKCVPRDDRFECELKNNLDQVKEIQVKAVRDGQGGGIVSYDLPLKFATPHTGH